LPRRQFGFQNELKGAVIFHGVPEFTVGGGVLKKSFPLIPLTCWKLKQTSPSGTARPTIRTALLPALG
jgi:hypothetical protein